VIRFREPQVAKLLKLGLSDDDTVATEGYGKSFRKEGRQGECGLNAGLSA